MKKEAQFNKIPRGVKVISILYYLASVFTIIIGILFLLGSSDIATGISDALKAQIIESGREVIGGALITMGIGFILFGIIGLIIGRKLWQLRNWARIVIIAFSVLGTLTAIASLIQLQYRSIVGLIINLAIGIYLIFSSKVKGAFK
ncbi:MAG: hypothetical protein ABIE22_04380 [archaeon]